jgi:hypothetical protein
MEFLIFTLLLFVLNINSLEITLNGTRIFYNGSIHPHFNFSNNHKSSDCTSGRNIYFETPLSHQTEFKFIKDTINDTFNNLSLNSAIDIVDTDLSSLDESDKVSTVLIVHLCNEKKLKDSSSKWTKIILNFNYNKIDYVLKFIKFCEKPSMNEAILSGLILFTISTLFLYLACIKDIKFDAEDIKEQGELKAWHGIVFVIFGSVILLFIFYFIQLANFVITLIVSIQSAAALYLTSRTFIEDINIDLLKRTVYQTINLQQLILIVVSVIVLIAWLITKHWLLNNLLGFCLIFTALSILHINNLKICTIILSLTYLYDAFWVFLSPLFFEKNVMETAAIKLVLPIKLELPVFYGNNPLKDCMFLGLGDIIIPGLLSKFSRNLDKAKNINIYFNSSIVFYVIGLLLCGGILVIFNYPQPALFYICPSMLIGVICLSCSRKEFTEIWKGEHNLEHININHNRQIDDIFSNEFNDGETHDLESSNESIN